ncbi:MAG: dihydroorotate dehydrogenase electron transfer subunit [Armatimonadota bacterium]
MRVVQAELLSLTEVAPEHCLAVLACADVAQQARPGQAVHLRCGDTYDPLLRRPISIADVSDDKRTLSLLFRVVGRGTRILANTAVGSAVDVLGPLGNGYNLSGIAAFAWRHERPIDIVLVAGGYGVGPVHFGARHLAQHRQRDQARLHALLGAASADLLVFADELRALTDEAHITTEDGSRGRRGVVTDPLEELCESRSADLVLCCGPTGMMRRVAEVCREHGIPCQASLEAHMGCGVGACLGCVIPVRGDGGIAYRRICRDGPVFDASTVVWEALP